MTWLNHFFLMACNWLQYIFFNAFTLSVLNFQSKREGMYCGKSGKVSGMYRGKSGKLYSNNWVWIDGPHPTWVSSNYKQLNINIQSKREWHAIDCNIFFSMRSLSLFLIFCQNEKACIVERVVKFLACIVDNS